MTPKAKAKEIFKKYAKGKDEDGWYLTEFDSCSKLCALIAVEEILSEYQSMSDLESVLVINNKPTFVVHQLVYWMEVKQNIQKL